MQVGIALFDITDRGMESLVEDQSSALGSGHLHGARVVLQL